MARTKKQSTEAAVREILCLVEQSDLPVRATLRQLGVPRSTFYKWESPFAQATQTLGATPSSSPSPRRLWVWARGRLRWRCWGQGSDRGAVHRQVDAVGIAPGPKISGSTTEYRHSVFFSPKGGCFLYSDRGFLAVT